MLEELLHLRLVADSQAVKAGRPHVKVGMAIVCLSGCSVCPSSVAEADRRTLGVLTRVLICQVVHVGPKTLI